MDDEGPHDHPGASYDYFGRTKASTGSSTSYADPLDTEAPYVDPRASYNPFPNSQGSRANSGSTPPRSTANGPKGDFIPKSGSAFPGNGSYSFNPGYPQYSPPESPTAPNRHHGSKSYSNGSSIPPPKRAGTWASVAPSPTTIFGDDEPSYFSGTTGGRRASYAPRADAGGFATTGRPPISPRSPVPPRFSASSQKSSTSIPRSGHRASIFDDEISGYGAAGPSVGAFSATARPNMSSRGTSGYTASSARPAYMRTSTTSRRPSGGRGLLGGDGGF